MKTTTSVSSASAVHPDENYRLHTLGKMLARLARGMAAALVFPIEAPVHLRRGIGSDRRVWIRWLLSATALVSGIAAWVSLRATFFDGRDRTGAILGYGIAFFAACLLNGGWRERGGSGARAYAMTPIGDKLSLREHGQRRGYPGHGNNRQGNLGHGRHLHHGYPLGRERSFRIPPGSGFGSGEGSATAAVPAASGVCIRNCPECKEEICRKTGKPRQRGSA